MTRLPRFLKASAVVLAGLLLLYVGGYVLLRINHQIIHRSMDDGRCWTGHTICGGDARLIGAAINSDLAAAYAPLCYLELWYWKIRQPLGDPVPPDVRSRRNP